MSSCNDLSETVRAKMKLLMVYYLQNVILCEERMGCLMFSKNCVDSVCARCKDTAKKILAHFQAILDEKHTGALIKWEQWERKEVTVNIRKDGKFQTQEKLKLVCTEKSGSIKSAVDNLVQIWNQPCQGVDMRRHLHNASWQDLQFERCKNLVNINTADF